MTYSYTKYNILHSYWFSCTFWGWLYWTPISLGYGEKVGIWKDHTVLCKPVNLGHSNILYMVWNIKIHGSMLCGPRSCLRVINRKNIIFSSFSLRCESCHKTQKDYPIALKFGTLKGSTSWYPIWLQYHKWLQSYKQLFAKNNTNMLSCLQDKLLMARSWKSARRQGNYWTSNLLLFERNWTKDHEDTQQWVTITHL